MADTARDITCEEAAQALEQGGFAASAVRRIQEGSNHYVFDVMLQDGRPAICKFAKTRATEQNVTEANTDTLFGGPLSLERERAIFDVVRTGAGLPAPEVYAVAPSPFGSYILLEKMPGVSHKEFLHRQGHSLSAFTHSLDFLGRDMAKLHRAIRPDGFGDYLAPGHISPGCANFADRFLAVVDRRIRRAEVKGMLGEREAARVAAFFHGRFADMAPALTVQARPPALVFTDMHGDNFFVDETGRPSGYFDLESAQAAPAALEYYGFRFFLFNFFDEDAFRRGEDAFFEGYAKEGGPYLPETPADQELIDLLAGCRLLEISQSYWGYVDGIRDLWGEKILALLNRYMDTGQVDYMALGDIWRERDGQPRVPAKG